MGGGIEMGGTLNEDVIKKAAKLLSESQYAVAFTGAGISVESGIPPFRGEEGLWSRYDPMKLSLSYFLENPKEAWEFYWYLYSNYFQGREPNDAHRALAELERKGLIKAIITQNIDDLHERAGSKNVIKLHGDANYFKCLDCGRRYFIDELRDYLKPENFPPTCPQCRGLIKPDVVLFEESLPDDFTWAVDLMRSGKVDLLLIVGTSGEVYPAGLLPYEAKERGAWIIEVNLKPSTYTRTITDYFLEGRATVTLKALLRALEELK